MIKDKELLIKADDTTITATATYPTASTTYSNLPKGRNQINVRAQDTDDGDGNEVYYIVIKESDNADGSSGEEILRKKITAGIDAATDDPTVIKQVFEVTKKYVQVEMNLSGTTPSLTFGAYFSPDELLVARDL